MWWITELALAGWICGIDLENPVIDDLTASQVRCLEGRRAHDDDEDGERASRWWLQAHEHDLAVWAAAARLHVQRWPDAELDARYARYREQHPELVAAERTATIEQIVGMVGRRYSVDDDDPQLVRLREALRGVVDPAGTLRCLLGLPCETPGPPRHLAPCPVEPCRSDWQ